MRNGLAATREPLTGRDLEREKINKKSRDEEDMEGAILVGGEDGRIER